MNENSDAMDAAVHVWSLMTDEEEAALIEYLDGRSSD